MSNWLKDSFRFHRGFSEAFSNLLRLNIKKKLPVDVNSLDLMSRLKITALGQGKINVKFDGQVESELKNKVKEAVYETVNNFKVLMKEAKNISENF